MAPRRALSSWCSAALLALLAGCTRAQPTIPDPVSRPSDPFPLGPGCDAQPDPHCNNLVNRVLVPMLRGANLPFRDEASSELCRRMALDLVGRVPTTEEFAQCSRETAEQSADRFMASPEYVRQQRRNWGERFYNLDEQWYEYAVEVDDLVEQLYREFVPYQDFMTRLLVHPGFYATFRGDDWSSNVVRYALGRNARADEIAALRPLARSWNNRRFCDGTVWWNVRTQRNGTNENADGSCGRDEYGVNFCRCRADDGSPLCATNVFGQRVDFGTDGCANTEHEDDEFNQLRVTEVGAGRGPVCPGQPFYNQCQDRSVGDHGPEGQLRRLNGVTDGQRNSLYSLGRALAARPDFWEAEVDRELRRFLDWWQAGLRRPDYDIPLVRSTLAAELRRTGSVRQLQRTIVTSLLYTQRGEFAANEATNANLPVWAAGPTRIMTAERWLDSAFYVTFGDTQGICDFRFVTENYDWRMLVNRGLAMQPPTTSSLTTHYREWARSVSGCSASQGRPMRSTLAIVTAQHEIAQRLCGAGTQVYPPNTPDAVDRAIFGTVVNWQYQRFLGRAPSEEERTTAVEEMVSCNTIGGAQGCRDSGYAAMRWFCARLLDSAEFAVF